jgi:beta-N-acetylhexosaminidase
MTSRAGALRLAAPAAIVVVLIAVAVVSAEAPSGEGAPPQTAGQPGASLGASPRSSGQAAARRVRGARTGASTDVAALKRDLGQTIIARYAGPTPSPSLLARVRAGQVGGVILFSEDFADGDAAAAAGIRRLQAQARRAGTWPLLVMTDQEGGEVKRVADAPPTLAPSQMSSARIAGAQGHATGAALAALGINVDLAPVADVERIGNSFLGSRSFGRSPALVADYACAFARGLAEAGVAYTLKHFPGLGRAAQSTDEAPVSIGASTAALRTDYAAYRRCGRGARTLVMVSSAGYPALTGTDAPAVMDREIYARELRAAGIEALTISDDMQAPAVVDRERPALHALNAGLDLLLYASTEEGSALAYAGLSADLKAGLLRRSRLVAAARSIEKLKAELRG